MPFAGDDDAYDCNATITDNAVVQQAIHDVSSGAAWTN